MTPLVWITIAFLAVLASLAAIREIRRRTERRCCVKLHAEIASIAEDLSTEPGGISYEELVYAPLDWLEDLLAELKELPTGSRHLRVAWEIINSDDYKPRHRG